MCITIFLNLVTMLTKTLAFFCIYAILESWRIFIYRPSQGMNIIIMALPGHRHTSSKRKRRASHHTLTKKVTNTCEKCSAPRLPHHACPQCGAYRGRTVARAA